MIKTTKIYIVVFLCLILARTSVFAQYTGGSADGAHTDILNLTACTTPPQFFAYFGGAGDGAHTDLVTYTSCGTPPQFFAYMGGTADGANTDLLTLTACATPPSQFFAYMGGTADGAATDLLTLTACAVPPSQFFAYMGGTADGAVTDQLTLTACTTPPSQFYAYFGGSGDGFSKDNIIYCPNAKPVVDFSATPLTICAGDSIQFTDLSTNSPFIWKWTFTGGAVATSTINNPKILYNTAGTYAVKLKAQNGIGADSLTKAAYITVNAIPLANAGSNVSICKGSSTTLSASGGTTYSWTPATALSSTTIANPIANPTITTNYTVTVTSGGCSAMSSVVVTVNPIPTANAGSNVSICNGSSTTLSASGGGTYSWSPATALSSTTIANPIANPTITTSYTVTVSNGVCSGTSVVTVSVNPLPLANAGTNTVICNGASASLGASGGTSYNWLPATFLNSSTIANPIASPTTTTNYTVTVSNGSCSANSIVTVSVTPLPNANAGSGVSICNGASTTFSASGGTSYSWTPATGLSSSTIANPVANPTLTTTYTVNVTSNGCSKTDVVTVTVTPALTVSAGSGVSICNGSSTTLNASGGSSYSWSPSTGLSSTNVFNPVASPTVTTIYTVTVNSGGCSGTDAVTVTVNALPVATVSASGPTTFCAGNNVILTTSAGNSYLWSNGATTQSINVTTSGNYSVTVTNGSGCSSTSGVTNVIVNTPVAASINAGGATTFCQGGNVTLTANSGSSYGWSTFATTQSISVSSSGIYSVTVSDINGCGSSSASVSITVNPNPATPVVSASGPTNLCIGSNVTLSSNAASSYLWNTGAVTSTINVSTAGSYSVTNYNSFGCGATSSGITVNVNDPLADFTGTPLLVFIPTAAVNFTAITTGFAPYTYLWNFGDGTTSTLAAPGHTYTTVAFRTVSLTVTDNTGCSKSIIKSNYVEVEQLFPSTAMITGTSFDLSGVSFVDPITGIMSLSDGNCVISVDSGKIWNPLPTGNTNPLTGASTMVGKWFVTGANGTILLSTNNGSSWTPFTTGTTETFNGSSFSSTNNGFAVGTNGTIHKYNGVSWAPETSGTSQHLHNVYALSNGNAIAVGDNQTILAYNGTSWLPQTSPLNFNVNDVRFSSLLKGYAAGTNGIILQTTNGGATWLPSLTGVGVDFNSIEVRGTDTAWAAGTNGIVYTTVNNGVSWVRYSVGYTNTQNQLRVTSGGKGHVVGNGSNGRFFNNGTGNGIVTGNTTLQSSLDNLNIYPSPAIDQFTISGYLSGPEKVTIDLKDAQAKLVKRIINKSLSGAYVEKINTEHYSPGIYFIHIQIGERSMVKKLIIMK